MCYEWALSLYAIEVFGDGYTLKSQSRVRFVCLFKMLFQLVLVVTILQQSLVGIVDAHSSHQSENQHQEIADHFHDVVERVVLSDASADSLDCHHCCHCHSPTYSVFPDAVSNFDVIKPAANFPSYRIEPLASLPVSLYRPPIS